MVLLKLLYQANISNFTSMVWIWLLVSCVFGQFEPNVQVASPRLCFYLLMQWCITEGVWMNLRGSWNKQLSAAWETVVSLKVVYSWRDVHPETLKPCRWDIRLMDWRGEITSWNLFALGNAAPGQTLLFSQVLTICRSDRSSFLSGTFPSLPPEQHRKFWPPRCLKCAEDITRGPGSMLL